jgi:hypothetical protein
MPYVALKKAVRHGKKDKPAIPPDSFLDELIAWGKVASEDIFNPKGTDEVYGKVATLLGPYENAMHRRAVMLEVMRVLAGHEADWNWNEGVDTHPQKEKKTLDTTETGAFQVSANSMKHIPELRHLVMMRVGSLDPIKFQKAMKKDHVLAMEYIARLLRNRIDANGPVLRLHQLPPSRGMATNLSRDAVKEFLDYLDPKGSDWTRFKGQWIVPLFPIGTDSF